MILITAGTGQIGRAPGDNAATADLPALLDRPAESLRGFLEAHRSVFLAER
jgi:hypothetical protein